MEDAERWLTAELNRIWLVAERALRSLQKAQIRPQPGHPSIAEVEGVLAARRVARRGAASGKQPEEESAFNEAIADAERSLDELRRAAPIGRLTESLQLRPLEVEVLVASLAPHIDPPLTDLFDVLRGSSNQRRGVDLALLAQMFRLTRADRLAMLDAVDPERPLLRWGLIQVISAESMQSFGSMTHRAISPTFQLVSLLCRTGQLDPTFSRHISVVHDQANLDGLLFDDDLRKEVAELCEAAARLESHDDVAEFPCLLLWGAFGVGKKTIAARVAAHAGRPMLWFDPTNVERGSLVELLRRVQCEALVRDALLYIGPIPTALLAEDGRELFHRLRGFDGLLVLGVDTLTPPRIFAEQPIQEIEISIPSEPRRLQLWEATLPEERRAEDVNLTSLANGFRLTPGEIRAISDESLAIANAERGRQVRHADVRNGIERRMRNELGAVARRLKVTGRWEDLVLPDQDMARIQEFIARKQHKNEVYEGWGFGPRVGYGKGLTALFSGPPGTGKTMLALLIAKSLDLEIYQVDLAQVLSKWVGETEKQLAKVFDQAERAHAVLLFDEADSLFAKRTEVKSSNDRYANLVVNYLLQRLEQYDGIAILTTNKQAQLDEALQRRLSMHLHLEIPEVEERTRLWRSFMPPGAPIVDDVDYHQLAREYELSGGYIKNAAVRAAFLAAARKVPIDMELLQLASGLELEDMGRVIVRLQEMEPDRPAAAPTVDFTDA